MSADLAGGVPSDHGPDHARGPIGEPALDPALGQVAEVVASVADVDQLPLEERLARFDAAHRALSEALGDPAALR